MMLSAQVLQARFRGLAGCAGRYTVSWLSRAFLFALTRTTGAIKLDADGVGIRLLARMAPDQHQWLWRLTGVEGNRRMSIGELFSQVGYTGPPELFSMWACLCADIPIAKLVGREQHLHQKCVAFQQLHGWSPHPAVLVEMHD